VHAFARRDRVVLAKGPVDLVSDGRRWQRNPRGNPRMAVGGTGDCLAGLCAGLMARGCTPFDAARLAVLWLTMTADRRWAVEGPCYLPEDLVADLPAVLRDLLTPLDRWPPVR
jgi:NAD(P)H-hydrate epimerase